MAIVAKNRPSVKFGGGFGALTAFPCSHFGIRISVFAFPCSHFRVRHFRVRISHHIGLPEADHPGQRQKLRLTAEMTAHGRNQSQGRDWSPGPSFEPKGEIAAQGGDCSPGRRFRLQLGTPAESGSPGRVRECLNGKQVGWVSLFSSAEQPPIERTQRARKLDLSVP